MEKECEQEIREDMDVVMCQKLLVQNDQLTVNVDDSFTQLENIGDSMLALLAALKEQSTETAISRKIIKDSLIDTTKKREEAIGKYEEWRGKLKQFLDIVACEQNVRDITDQVADAFGYLAQTLQEDLVAGTSNFRSSFSVKEPQCRVRFRYF